MGNADALVESLRSGPHAFLARLVGRWSGSAWTDFGDGAPPQEAPIRGETRLVLDGRFLVHEYEGGVAGREARGLAIHGYDLGTRRWETAWIDSFHNNTRVMFSLGERGATILPAAVLGSYPAEPDPDWGWRTTLEQPEPDKLHIVHANLTPAGEPCGGVEIRYVRA